MSSVLQIPTARAFVPLLNRSRYKGAHGGRGSGKCLAIGTLVLMADGRRVPVEQVTTGDQVMGPDSLPRRVLGTTRGRAEMFEVQQNGGETYIVNGEHILALKRAGGCDRYLTDGEIATLSVQDYIDRSMRWRANYRGFRSGPIEMPRKELPVPPYVFGSWIGDGCSDRQSITSMDEEIIREFVAWGESLGCHEVRRKKAGQRAYTIILTNVQGWPNPAKEVLRSLGVLGAKHVPEIYQTSTLSDRLNFLAGVVDTDGHYANGCFTVTQKDRGIIRAVKFVADTCGFRTSLRQKIVLIGGNPRPYWSLSISGSIERIPCRLPRKQAQTNPNKDWLCGVINVRSVGDGEYAGFDLDGDHLFLLGDCTVTHNSHFYAEMMVERHMMAKTASVCVREIQKSLAQSVKKLIEIKIDAMGFGRRFNILNSHIEDDNGGMIIFAGMQNHTADSIKSLEDYDIAWVEEAQSLSQRSLDLLRPTIRKPGSELWFGWNPVKPTDPIDMLLRGETPPPDAVVVEVNYRDNPFLPEVLRVELEYDRKRDANKFAHVWGGGYQTNSDAQVFKNWVVEEFTRPPGTIHRLGADWGFSVDPSCLVRCSIEGRRLYVDYEAYMIGCEIDQLPDLFDGVPDSRKWFITADSARPETISYMKRHGYPKINATIKGGKSVEEGIAFLQSFDIVVHPRCAHLIDELTFYNYKRDPLTEVVLPILEDKKNHLIDSLRYACEGARRAAKEKPKTKSMPWVPMDPGMGY